MNELPVSDRLRRAREAWLAGDRTMALHWLSTLPRTFAWDEADLAWMRSLLGDPLLQQEDVDDRQPDQPHAPDVSTFRPPNDAETTLLDWQHGIDNVASSAPTREPDATLVEQAHPPPLRSSNPPPTIGDADPTVLDPPYSASNMAAPDRAQSMLDLDDLGRLPTRIFTAAQPTYARQPAPETSIGSHVPHGETTGEQGTPAAPRSDFGLPARLHSKSKRARLEPGMRLGRYELLRLLGEGGMGAVYLARNPDRPAEPEVALKILHPDGAERPLMAERFLREARIAARLRHPNIVTVYDVELDPNTDLLYLAMEYLDGSAVVDWLTHGPLAPARGIEIGLAVAQALGAAHAEGVMHRDIKPDNIMLTIRREVKLVDLGLAKALGEETLTATGLVFGTPNYMSPEQARGDELDFRTDIYSLGATLYRIVTGVAPFARENPMQTMLAVMSEPVPDACATNPAVPPQLGYVLARAMAKDRDARFATAQAFERALRQVAES